MTEAELNISNAELLQKLHLIKDGKLKRSAVLLFYSDPSIVQNGSFIKIGKGEDSHRHLYQRPQAGKDRRSKDKSGGRPPGRRQISAGVERGRKRLAAGILPGRPGQRRLRLAGSGRRLHRLRRGRGRRIHRPAPRRSLPANGSGGPGGLSAFDGLRF